MIESTFFPVLSDLSTDEIIRLKRIAEKRTIKRGKVFISQNQELQGVYFIASGRCAIFTTEPDGKEFVYVEIKKGEVVGELSVLDNQKSSASVRALENLDVWFVEKTSFLKFFQSCPNFSKNIVLMLIRRLRKADEVIDRLAFLNVEQRIIAYFKERGVLHDRGITISPAPKPAELSRYVGASREMCGRVLRDLQSIGRLTQLKDSLFLRMKD